MLKKGLLIMLTVGTAAAWVLPGILAPRADWVTLTAPRYAVAGEPIELLLQVSGLRRAAYLTADLHWGGTRRESRGFLSTTGAQEVISDGAYAFTLPVSVRAELGFVSAVVYAGSTGRWGERTRAAVSEAIPVRRSATPSSRPSLRSWRMYPTSADTSPSASADDWGPSGPIPGLILGGLLLGAAILCVRAAAGSRAGARRAFWGLVSALLALAALAEVLGGSLAEAGRRLAEAHALYDGRRVFQRAVVTGVAIGTILALSALARRERRPDRSVLAAAVGIGTL